MVFVWRESENYEVHANLKVFAEEEVTATSSSLFRKSKIAIWCLFHQRSMRSFYVQKLLAKLFCAYVLGLDFPGARLFAQKLHKERWWNWPLVSQSKKNTEF